MGKADESVSWQPEVDEIHRRQELARKLGGEERVARQHAQGKLTIRERLEGLLDAGSLREFGSLAGRGEYEGAELVDFKPAGYVLGLGEIDGRTVAVGGEDYTSHYVSARRKEGWITKLAAEYRVPLIRLVEGFGGGYEFRAPAAAAEKGNVPRTSGARGGPGDTSHLPTMGSLRVLTSLLETVPVVAAPMGSVAGGPAGMAAGCHFMCMVKGSQIFPGGPPVAKRSLGEDVTKEELGGSSVHAHGSGVADNEAEDEADCFRQIVQFLSYLPSNVWEMPPRGDTSDPPERRDEELISFMPRSRRRPYDVRELFEHLLDRGSSFEMNRYFGSSVVTVFARLHGYPVGVIANDPLIRGGAIDGPSADKMAHFIDLCDTFHLPIVNLIDNPGFMVGTRAESQGTIRRGMRWMVAMDQSTVPWLAIILRKAYGVAGAGQSPSTGYNLRLAWPSAEWGGIPVEGGVAAVFRQELEEAEDPEARRAELEKTLNARRSPFRTAESFEVEDIIDPRETRPILCEWVERQQSRLRAELGPKRRGMRP